MKKRNIEEEIQNLDALVRDNEQVPSKLRISILKQVEVVRKCAKPRRSNKGRNQNQNSGLLKPVIISEEMARFANWDKDELHSRVDVTKVICVYVKNNKLQKPSNKKTILPDQLLKDLLRWDAAAEEMSVSVVSASEDANVFSVSKKPAAGDKEDVALKAGESYSVHVPLTYPKVQTKISVHLTKPEPTEEETAVTKKPKKEKKEKKASKPKKKEASDKASKPKKKKEPEPPSSGEE
jgi:hypothetical protein